MILRRKTLPLLLASASLPFAAPAQDAGSAQQGGGDKAVQLAPVAVRGVSVDAGYTRSDASGATKTDTPIIETPQAISVISNAQMRDQGVLTVQDALRYSAGVRADAYGVDSRGDDAFVRGTSFTQYLDGLRQNFGYAYARTEPYFLDRIEIVRGPSSVLYGQGTTGGLIALTSKRPQFTASHEIEAQVGNNARKQLAFDFTGPLDTAGHWAYRLIGVYRDSDSQIDHVADDRKAIAPSITWMPDQDTRWTLLANLQFDHNGTSLNFLPHAGTLLPNPNGHIPTQRFVSEPGFDRYDTQQRSVTSLFEHRFDDTWTFTQSMRYSHDNVDYRTLYPDVYSNPAYPFLDDAQRTVARYSYVSIDRHKRFVTDTHAQADFDVASTHHRLLIGLDIGYSHTDSRQGNGFDAVPFDLFDPVYRNGFLPPDVTPIASSHTRQTGLYAQDQITIGEHWIGTVGVRHDRATLTTGDDRSVDNATTSRFGLMYRFDSGLVPYVSYTESFQPLDSLDVYNRPYEPLRGKQYEAGVKYQPVGTATLLTATYYDLREENRLAPDPENPLNQIQAGKAKTRGVELEASTRIASHVDLIGTYTWTKARPDDGTIVAGLPKNQGSVWGVYHVNDADGDGFSFGAGARYIGTNYDETGVLKVPQKTLFDAMVAYTQGPWRFAVNAANVTDQRYNASCLARGDCFYGPRRSIVGSARYRF
ncbi:iron complex outermembrane recepter protein [Luteibacter sp. UNCMF331Sha3.1]|uniref:TonB-dependent siderophore receptor n=1 Tax=Luteibacter sp. UNCMF331Sha3.1 TaxID=1502760 RepID=UPI0008C2B635|nr:TonB-dependent siderophore receptor [Luteibacter sp. UNCMF331Sha3.1]SEM52977.1 iron complex outermembrane recepter protein [Luteibacter sp. UNCMF331Sha3.1]